MPEWFVTLGYITLSVMMIAFLGSLLFTGIVVIAAIYREHRKKKKGGGE